ncbi:hypothetical protein Tco_1572388 [Tanacetum coccineum]
MGSGGGRTRGRSGDQGDGRIDGQGSEEFLACNPKEYDGKRGAIVYTSWIEKIELVQDMSGCRDCQEIANTLTDEALRNGSIKRNPEKRENGGEPSKDRNVRDDKKGLGLEMPLLQTPTL